MKMTTRLVGLLCAFWMNVALAQTNEGIWEPVQTGVTGQLRGGAYGARTYVVTMRGVPGGVITSEDSTVWTFHGLDGDMLDVAYGSGRFVAIGTSGALCTSDDGITWTAQPRFTSQDFQAIIHDGTQFIVGSGVGGIFTSPDGIAWTPRESTVGKGFYGMAYGGGRYVAVGTDQTVVWSDDAVHWSATVVTQSFMGFHGVGYGDGIWVAVGNPNSQLWSSPDGAHWTQRNSGISADMDAVAYACGRLWVSAYSGDIITSSDGVSWTPEVTGVSTRLLGIRYLNGRLLAFGDNGVMIRAIPHREPLELANGLVAYYPFNGNAEDVSGHGHTGIVTGATLTEDRLGNPNRAYFFRGTNSGDKITIASFPDLDNKSQATWAWWAKRTNSPPLPWHSHVLRKEASWILFQWANDPIPTTWRSPFWFNEVGSWVAPLYGSLDNLNDGAWHFYAVVLTNRTLSTFVDGILIHPVESTGGNLGETLRPSPDPLFIGGDEFSTGSFGGWLDDIRIYDRALSLQEISTLHRLPRPMLQIETAAVRLKWYAVSNATYEIQCSGDFQSWTNMVPPVVGSGAFTNLIDWTDGGRKFYRIIRQ